MANVEGSIYRVENGVAVPYANLNFGSSDAPEGINVASRFAAGSSMGTVSTLNARATVCGDITSLYLFVYPATAALTIGTASQFNSVEVLHQTLSSDDTDALLIPYADASVATSIAYNTSHEPIPIRALYRKELSGSDYIAKLNLSFYGQQTLSFDTSSEALIFSFAFVNSRSL